MALTAGLSAHGIEAEILDPGCFATFPRIRGHTLLAALDPLRALHLLVRRRHIGIVVSVFESGAAVLLAARAATRFRPPIAVWDLGLTEGWKLRERLLDFVIPRADALLVLDQSQLTYIARRWHRTKGVYVVGHAVDTEFFHPAPDPTNGYLLAVGDDTGRDYPTLLQAVDGQPWQLRLRTNNLSATPLPPNATLVPRGDAKALRALYAGASMLVLPTHHTLNASGISALLEASAMAKPCIVSDNPGIGDFVQPERTCLMVPAGNPQALRAAIRRLADDAALRARLGTAARAFVERHCAPAAFTARLAACLHAVAA